jgi:hypothetical protein
MAIGPEAPFARRATNTQRREVAAGKLAPKSMTESLPCPRMMSLAATIITGLRLELPLALIYFGADRLGLIFN